MSCEKTALLPVSADEAFALLTQPERLRRWQVVAARVDLRAGGEFRWNVTPGHVAAGTFREIEPGKRLVLDFGWEGEEDHAPGTSTLIVTIEPQAEGTLVRLVHEGLTEEQAAAHLEGWTHFLERLEKAAVTGDAGPDEWVYAPSKLDPLTAADATLAAAQHVLRGITASDADKATACAEFTVSQLVDHLVTSMVQLGGMAGVTVTTVDGGSFEDRVAFAAQQVTEAWGTRGLEGTVEYGGGTPAAFAAGMVPLELLVHTWDLATATGQSVHVSDEVVRYCTELAEAGISDAVREGGSFGPAVEAPPGADALARLAAFTGRAA